MDVMTRSAALLLAFLLVGCDSGLRGTWSGIDDTGLSLTLVFESDGQMEMIGPAGPLSTSLAGAPRLEYEVADEMDPPRLSMVFVLEDSIRRALPLGIYKIENGQLVLCMARPSRPNAFGEPTFEWPTDFSGRCFALDRAG